MARKRKRADHAPLHPCKSLKSCAKSSNIATTTPCALLALYYPRVLPLKNFFLDRLPTTSRVRRRKIESLAANSPGSLLNTAVVGVLTEPDACLQQSRNSELASFSQSQLAVAATSTVNPQTLSVKEVIDFAIWHLFQNAASLPFGRPRHLLCNGLQRTVAQPNQPTCAGQTLQLPGLVQQHPNDNHKALRQQAWEDIFALLGAGGESIFSSLLLDCGLFIALKGGDNNYFQLSGTPIADLHLLPGTGPNTKLKTASYLLRKPAEIRFVRNRILYSKSALNVNGRVHFGLKHVHVLQRYRDHDDYIQHVHILKHVFPLQFGLQNVFASPPEPGTGQLLPDFTYREDEINPDKRHPPHWLPKRLRVGPLNLIRRLRKLHSRCSYSQLLQHYCRVGPSLAIASCPIVSNTTLSDSAPFVPQPKSPSLSIKTPEAPITITEDTSYLPYATPTANVVAFCQATLRRLLPHESFGDGADGHHNWRVMRRNIATFVSARRFETMSLQQVTQHMKITALSWLASEKEKLQQRLCQTELKKRTEIFYEFVYYIFDSILSPLIRSNFYVTESAAFRNKLLYFRHDVWRQLSIPSLALLRLNLYKPLKPADLRKALTGRSLGYSHVRIMPKSEGIRTITNLKRKTTKSINGRRVHNPSINAQLGPAFSALNHERYQNPELLGSSLFSVSDIHEKLKVFKDSLPANCRLYFVKVDVQSCFDTIPQARLLELVDHVLSSEHYKMTKYADVKLANKGNQRRQKFVPYARPVVAEEAAFTVADAERISEKKKGSVLVEVGASKDWHRRQLLGLLQDHVQNNIVKIGKKHMKQKSGIPQGSVVSTLLCNYFYAAFEAEHLDEHLSKSSLFLRLIDDFLLITADKAVARTFTGIMIQPHPLYGITTNPEKSLANFDIQVDGKSVPHHRGRGGFPYCGMRIDPVTLSISKDRTPKDASVSNGLSVETANSIGMAFQKKMLLALKIQTQKMILDGSLNTRHQVLTTLMEIFTETAIKMCQYLKQLPRKSRPTNKTIIITLEDIINYSARYMQSVNYKGPDGRLNRKQVCWLAAVSMEQVFLRKQSAFWVIISWLQSLKAECESSVGMQLRGLSCMLEKCRAAFKDHVY